MGALSRVLISLTFKLSCEAKPALNPDVLAACFLVWSCPLECLGIMFSSVAGVMRLWLAFVPLADLP